MKDPNLHIIYTSLLNSDRTPLWAFTSTSGTLHDSAIASGSVSRTALNIRGLLEIPQTTRSYPADSRSIEPETSGDRTVFIVIRTPGVFSV